MIVNGLMFKCKNQVSSNDHIVDNFSWKVRLDKFWGNSFYDHFFSLFFSLLAKLHDSNSVIRSKCKFIHQVIFLAWQLINFVDCAQFIEVCWAYQCWPLSSLFSTPFWIDVVEVYVPLILADNQDFWVLFVLQIKNPHACDLALVLRLEIANSPKLWVLRIIHSDHTIVTADK